MLCYAILFDIIKFLVEKLKTKTGKVGEKH